MDRSQLATEDFDYNLPEDRIAKFPLEQRNKSKLLLYKEGVISEDRFENLHDHLPSKSTLVFNDTKVMAARLFFHKATGGKVEIFVLTPHEKTVEEALNTFNSCIWECMVGNLKRFYLDEVLIRNIAGTNLKASIHHKERDKVLILFEWEGDITFSSILEAAGLVPLPPYLNRDIHENDKETYQTVYAKNEGAVAAPTAGLHFVDEQINDLENKGFNLEYLTLFVGVGTFRPLRIEKKLVEHKIHRERIVIQRYTIDRISKSQGPIISVGTTSLRSLESLYWIGVKIATSVMNKTLELHQNDAYELSGDASFKEICTVILNYMDDNKMSQIDFHSELFIMPGYQWKAIDGLLTNFHQPISTLLALIASWVGEDWRKIYKYALDSDFRFLSYGDSSLLLR